MKLFHKLVRSEGDPMVLQSGAGSLNASDKLARGLGWFSIGLGLTQLFAARRVTRSLGVEGMEPLMRAFGVREIGSGMLSLSVDKKVGLWSRVAGDTVDILALMAALHSGNRRRDNVGFALAMVLGVTLLDIVAAQAVTRDKARVPAKLRDFSDRSGFPRGARRGPASAG